STRTIPARLDIHANIDLAGIAQNGGSYGVSGISIVFLDCFGCCCHQFSIARIQFFVHVHSLNLLWKFRSWRHCGTNSFHSLREPSPLATLGARILPLLPLLVWVAVCRYRRWSVRSPYRI